MTTEEIVLDCSGREIVGLVTNDDKGLIQRKIKYAFQVVRVNCRVKWKFRPPAEAGTECAELKLKGGPKPKRDVGVGDTKFTEWSRWTECSSECGAGTQSRTRECVNKKKRTTSVTCTGPLSQVRVSLTVNSVTSLLSGTLCW